MKQSTVFKNYQDLNKIVHSFETNCTVLSKTLHSINMKPSTVKKISQFKIKLFEA